VDLEVPATSEIVIEGEMSMDPASFKPEGPFGEYPGYYTSVWSEPRPVLNVKCVTHRQDPILESWIGMAAAHPQVHKNIIASAQLWQLLEHIGVPGVTGVYSEPAQPGMVYVSIQQAYYGHAKQVAAALWASSAASSDSAKYVVVTDADVDITSTSSVMGALVNRTRGAEDITIFPGTYGGNLDPGVHPDQKKKAGGVGTWDRVLIDATWPWEWEPRKEWGSLKHPPPCQAEPEMLENVRRRWSEYGFEKDISS
ncbi:MAG: UbiD family decarboxylase, partial [Dehalococcoidia bacterium]|nr:UbiD family decarboxylase [Dehalococcoidia bacterium]